MTDQIASLVVEVDASGAKKAAVDLDSLTKAADRADAAANDLEGSTRKLSAAEKTVADEAKRAMGAFNGLAGEQEALARTQDRLNSLHGTAIKNTGALNQATLNLGRQFTDLGVQIGGGANPLIALMQQLPQITDGLAMAKTQGISAGQAFQALYASVIPIAAPILAIGAAAGAAFGLFERAIDQNTKHATSWSDTWRATVKVVGDNIMDGPIGDALKWLGGAFSKTLDFIVDGVTGWYDRTVGLFIAAYKTITTHWKDLPAAFGAIMVGAANGVISGIQFIVDGAMGAINYFRKKAGMDEFARVELPKLTQANNAAARDFEKYWKDATASVRKSREDFADNVARQADREYEKHQKAAKATQKAVEDHTKAIKLNTDTVAAANVVDLEALRIAAAFEAQQKSLKTAANDNIRTFDAAGVSIPTALENMATEAERVAYQTRDIVYGVEDIADAINRNDWTSAFSSLARVLVQVQNAFKAGASSADKFAAAAALAQGVGNIVGGSTGSAISGAASGALAGATFGVPGAIIGGAVGLVGSLFGSSKAKKQQRAQEAAQRAAKEAARQQQISDTTFSLNVALLEAQGKAEEALAMTRKRELDALAKLDPSLVALQQQLYDLEDVANATAKAAEERARWAAEAAKAQADQQKIALDLMALDDAVTGGNSAVLAARQIELAALDATSQELKRIYYARLDESEALAKQTAANEKVAEAARQAQEAADELARTYQTTNIGLMRQLMAMDDAVLGTTSARDAIRADELAKLDDTGKYLQGIIWAREDEAAVMAKQAEEAARQAEAIEAARNALSQSYEREKSAIEATRQKFEGLAKSLRDFSGSISSDLLATADPASQRAAAASAFFDAANRAALGDFDAASLLPKLGEAFKVAAEAAATDQLAYLRDLTAIKRASDKAAETAERQVSAADRQLDVLNQQVAGLLSIDESVDSVAVAIEKLIAAQGGNRDVAGAAAAAAGLTAAQLSANGNAAFAYGLANSMVGKALAGSTDAAYTAIANAAKGFTPSAGSYFAEGGVFTNGIVSQPTNFSIGQMGEAGPEAIVPLVRGPEGLGVRMSGGNDNSAVIARLEARLASMEAALIAIATSNNSMDRREKRAEVEGYYVRGATPDDPVMTEAA